jgi:hypothetical protein
LGEVEDKKHSLHSLFSYFVHYLELRRILDGFASTRMNYGTNLWKAKLVNQQPMAASISRILIA